MKTVARYLRLWWAFLQNCLMREMEFRSHFLLTFVMDILWYAVQLGLFDDDFEIGTATRFRHLEILPEVYAHPILKHPNCLQSASCCLRSVFIRIPFHWITS